jgi:Uma2 family endonuclease
MSITIAKWTIDEYHQLVDSGILDDRRVELLKGIIVEMPPEGTPHVFYCMESVKYLRLLLGARAEVREAHPITLPDDSEPEPDIAIVAAPNSQYLAHHPYPEDIFWLVEYSNTTLAKDLQDKKQIYAEAGIREYWVVNLQASELIVFRDRSVDTYNSELKLSTGNISPLSFPDVSIVVERSFSIT